MTTTYKIGWIIVAVLLVGMFLVQTVSANPSLFSIKQTDTATSTKSYMLPGTATTSVVFDANLGGDSFASNSATLFLQLTGSSTPIGAAVATTTFKVQFEYAQGGSGIDCLTTPTVCDWYSNSAFATTTQLGWQTTNGLLNSSTTPTKISLDVPMPTRYVRAVVSIPATVVNNTNGAVWAQFVAKKENR